jgi:tRNA(fMet)-specific endonuclease VapC
VLCPYFSRIEDDGLKPWSVPNAVLTYLPVLPLDNAVAVQYGVLAAAVRDRRRDAFDRLIAAHAASLGLTLATNNEANFRDYPGLIVENWV